MEVEVPDRETNEMGFSDRQAGAGHSAVGGNTAVDWIEVYGQSVKRGVDETT